MMQVYVTAFPYATVEGTIRVPDDTDDVYDFVFNHWNDIEFFEPFLDYKGCTYECDYLEVGE